MDLQTPTNPLRVNIIQGEWKVLNDMIPMLCSPRSSARVLRPACAIRSPGLAE